MMTRGSFLTVYLWLCNRSPCLKKKEIILNPPSNSSCKVVRIIIFCIIHPSVVDQGQQCSPGQQGRDKPCPHPSLISSQLSIPLESQVNSPQIYIHWQNVCNFDSFFYFFPLTKVKKHTVDLDQCNSQVLYGAQAPKAKILESPLATLKNHTKKLCKI